MKTRTTNSRSIRISATRARRCAPTWRAGAGSGDARRGRGLAPPADAGRPAARAHAPRRRDHRHGRRSPCRRHDRGDRDRSARAATLGRTRRRASDADDPVLLRGRDARGTEGGHRGLRCGGWSLPERACSCASRIAQRRRWAPITNTTASTVSMRRRCRPRAAPARRWPRARRARRARRRRWISPARR